MKSLVASLISLLLSLTALADTAQPDFDLRGPGYAEMWCFTQPIVGVTYCTDDPDKSSQLIKKHMDRYPAIDNTEKSSENGLYSF